MVFRSAKAFRANAQPFRDTMAQTKDIKDAAREALQNLGEMAAAATNLALSVELNLKGLAITSGFSPLEIHELDALYQDLPKPLRDSIEAKYNAAPKAAKGQAVGVSVGAPTKRSTDHSLLSVLRRSNVVFETWRYLHEALKPGKAIQGYEFHYLGTAADVLDWFADEILKRVKVEPGRQAP